MWSIYFSFILRLADIIFPSWVQHVDEGLHLSRDIWKCRWNFRFSYICCIVMFAVLYCVYALQSSRSSLTLTACEANFITKRYFAYIILVIGLPSLSIICCCLFFFSLKCFICLNCYIIGRSKRAREREKSEKKNFNWINLFSVNASGKRDSMWRILYYFGRLLWRCVDKSLKSSLNL